MTHSLEDTQGMTLHRAHSRIPPDPAAVCLSLTLRTTQHWWKGLCRWSGNSQSDPHRGWLQVTRVVHIYCHLLSFGQSLSKLIC